MEITEASVWGEVYEIVTKRGSLMALADAGLLSGSHPLVAQWSSKQLVDVLIRVKELLYGDILNAKIYQNIENYFLHLSKVAFGQGYTNTREFLRKIKPKTSARKQANPSWSLSGLWCPLTMPSDETCAWITDYTTQEEAEEIQKFMQQTKEAFCGQFGIAYQANMLNKGMYGRADFLAVIRVKRAHHILVQEYSCFYTKNEAEIFDADDSFTYLNEYKRYVMQSESHSVFSFVNAEAQEIPFKFSDQLRSFLPAFVRKEKPLFKLAQGCSYASTFAEVYKKLLNFNHNDGEVNALHLNVMAITSRGSEYITAEYTAPEKSPELTIIEQLGQEYRHGVLTLNDIQQRIQLQRELIEYLVNEPLKNMNRLLAQNISNITFGQDLTFSVTEEIEGFYNPNQQLEKDQVFDLIEQFVDQPYQENLRNLVEADIKKINAGQVSNKKAFTLRDLHKCAVVMALMESKRGQINYICLGGTPGIGKTSSVKTMLEVLEGFFFFYASPRVLINDDVVTDLAKNSVTVTSNSEVVSQTKQIYKEMNGKDTVVNARGGALVGGIQNFKIDPSANILLFDQDRYRALKDLDESRQSDQHYVAASESKSVAMNKKVARVFESLGYATSQLLRCNPEIRKHHNVVNH